MQFPTTNSKLIKRYGLYKCFCGKEFKVATSDIKSGNTKSCGCINERHGLVNHRLYNTWAQMIQRCTNENNQAYKRYGGRGITVFDEWRDNFTNFYNWAIKNGYKENLSIDRIDNYNGYNPSNCRWATTTTQARNKRVIQSNNTSGYRGVYFNKTLNKYYARICVDYKRILIGYFESSLEAAEAYDFYVFSRGLQHTDNGLISF